MKGRYPHILLNIPHASIGGLHNAGWADYGKLSESVLYLTDWHTDWLFDQGQPNVAAVAAYLSRFVVDCERLENDPMEKNGQGILYTDFDGNHRTITPEQNKTLMDYYQAHKQKLHDNLTPNTLLLDCHSFPSDKSDVDICIGYNDDWSKPDDETLQTVKNTFEKAGYSVAFNSPYSNSMAPAMPFKYQSMMIELNKRTYMDEKTLKLLPEAETLRKNISFLYKLLLP